MKNFIINLLIKIINFLINIYYRLSGNIVSYNLIDLLKNKNFLWKEENFPLSEFDDETEIIDFIVDFHFDKLIKTYNKNNNFVYEIQLIYRGITLKDNFNKTDTLISPIIKHTLECKSKQHVIVILNHSYEIFLLENIKLIWSNAKVGELVIKYRISPFLINY